MVGLATGLPAARAAFLALPDEPVPTHLVLIDADWNESDLSGRRALLSYMDELANVFAARTVRRHVDDPPGPPQYQENEAASVELLTRTGYAPLPDGLRWRSAGPPERQPTAPLPD